MTYPHKEQTPRVVENPAGTPTGCGAAESKEISRSQDCCLRIMYKATNSNGLTTHGGVLDQPVAVVHTVKSVAPVGKFPPKPTTPCIIFPGKLNRDGYGMAYRRGRTMNAQRAAWEDAHGLLPAGKGHKVCVLHACDNRACWRLDHLWVGTQQDNMRDMAAKGRKRGGRSPAPTPAGMPA